MSFYDITDTDEKGKVVSMSEYVGKVVLIVNVASQCGHTNTHYTQLPKLYDEYHARGFEILAFPCNQFGAQEPGSAEDICSFVDGYDSTMRKKLRFLDKGDVNGKDARPLYKYLKEKAPEEDTGATDIRWNFGEYDSCLSRWVDYSSVASSPHSSILFSQVPDRS